MFGLAPQRFLVSLVESLLVVYCHISSLKNIYRGFIGSSFIFTVSSEKHLIPPFFLSMKGDVVFVSLSNFKSCFITAFHLV